MDMMHYNCMVEHMERIDNKDNMDHNMDRTKSMGTVI
jgi:hypothetical protein